MVGGNSKIFGIFTPKIGEMIQFDEHIFEMGWFNHQLDKMQKIIFSITSNATIIIIIVVVLHIVTTIQKYVHISSYIVQ